MCWISLSQPLRPLRPPGLDPTRHKPHPFPHIAHHPRPYYPSFLSSTSSLLSSSECDEKETTTSTTTTSSSRRYVKLPSTHTFTSPIYRIAVPNIQVPKIDVSIPIPEIPIPIPIPEVEVEQGGRQRRIRRTGRLHDPRRASSPPPPVPAIPPRFCVPPHVKHPGHAPPASSGGGSSAGGSGGNKRVRFESPVARHGHGQGRRRAPCIVDPPSSEGGGGEVNILPYPAKDYRTGVEHGRKVRRATRAALGEVGGGMERGKPGLRRVRGREGLNGSGRAKGGYDERTMSMKGKGGYPPFGGLGSWL